MSTGCMWETSKIPARAAHRVVLLDLGAIVQRHVPAAEGDDAGAQALVLREKGGAMTHGVSPAWQW